MPFVTAFGGLIDIADLKTGDTVLISAASGSVGLAAIQIARMVGARPVALTRTRARCRQLLDAGAEAVIVTAEHDIVSGVKDLTDGEGARVIFDPVGGAVFADLLSAAARYGVIVVYGLFSSLGGEPTPCPCPTCCASASPFEASRSGSRPSTRRDAMRPLPSSAMD